MKNKILIIVGIFVVLLIGVIIMCLFRDPDDRPVKHIDSIKKFSYHYSDGNAMWAYTNYKIECEEKCIAIIKPNGIPEESEVEVEIDEKVINNLLDLLNKYEVGKWNGFRKSDKNVLDGHDFSLSIWQDDGTNIHASGYMKWPKNFREVSKELKEIFQPLYDTNKKEEK